MLRRLSERHRELDEGFTLIELLVVVLIIGLLAAIAIPVFLNQRRKAEAAQAKSDARHLANLQETYFVDNQLFVVAPDLATTKTVLPEYHPSGRITAVVMKNYQSDGVTLGTTQAAGGFCVAATDSYGETYVYDSLKGGLQPFGATCG